MVEEPRCDPSRLFRTGGSIDRAREPICRQVCAVHVCHHSLMWTPGVVLSTRGDVCRRQCRARRNPQFQPCAISARASRSPHPVVFSSFPATFGRRRDQRTKYPKRSNMTNKEEREMLKQLQDMPTWMLNSVYSCDWFRHIAADGYLKCMHFLRAKDPMGRLGCAACLARTRCIMKFAHANGCPWDAATCIAAAAAMSTASDRTVQRVPGGRARVAAAAASSPTTASIAPRATDVHGTDHVRRSGRQQHIGCLVYALINGCPCDQRACHAAAYHGNLECLHFLDGQSAHGRQRRLPTRPTRASGVPRILARSSVCGTPACLYAAKGRRGLPRLRRGLRVSVGRARGQWAALFRRHVLALRRPTRLSLHPTARHVLVPRSCCPSGVNGAHGGRTCWLGDARSASTHHTAKA